jgi:hypothetical protein
MQQMERVRLVDCQRPAEWIMGPVCLGSQSARV